MKIIYSYIHQGGTPSAFFKKMAEISVASANRTGYEVELWADLYGIDYFRNQTNCRFSVVKLLDVEQYKPLPEYWNFGKLLTYSLQKEPFLHVDFDTCLCDGFTIPESGDIITEMLRNYTMQKAFSDVQIFKADRLPRQLICSGLIGGYNLNVWQELFENAVKHCTQQRFHTTPTPGKEIAYLVGVEEFCVSQLADFYNLEVQALNHNFFMHWQGADKQQRFGQAIDIMYNYYF